MKHAEKKKLAGKKEENIIENKSKLFDGTCVIECSSGNETTVAKHKTMERKRANAVFIGIMAVLLLIQFCVMIFYGNKKAGFHEDEFYTYYSTNKTAGLFVNDRQWLEREDLRNDFVVLEGERFRYDVVKQMQSWDVHPPFYYYIFHTVCSLFPEVFSKWLGIGVNLIAFAICYVLLAYGAYMAVTQRAGMPGTGPELIEEKVETENKGKRIAFLSCLAWGFGGAVISGVMFIRMYQWLTLFVLLCLDLHLWAVKKQDFRIRSFFLPLMFTVFFGFLTQYYYIIFHFFLGAGFCFFLLREKKFRELAEYIAACGAGFLAALCYYPASLSHIFRGYRGTEAVSEFSNVSNTWERLSFFYGLFDDFVLNGTLSWWLLAICLLALGVGYAYKRAGKKESFLSASIGLMMFACAGYFFTVSKTALILGETSNRYQLPVYGILLFLLLYVLWELIGRTIALTGRKGPGGKVMMLAFSLVIMLIMGLALKNGRVFFLYEDEREIMAFVEEHKEEPVVIFYNDASPDNVWRLSDELMEYEKVYLASQGNPAPIEDEEIVKSDRLLVYVADYEDKEKCLEGLLRVNESLSQYRKAAEKGLWTLYEVY